MIYATCECYIPQRDTCELRGFPGGCYYAAQIAAMIQKNCWQHKYFEEWQKCKACDALARSMINRRFAGREP
jgi:hypothetical protein